MTEELKQAKKRLETTFEERLKRRLKSEDGNYWYSSYKIVTEQLVESVNNAARYKEALEAIQKYQKELKEGERGYSETNEMIEELIYETLKEGLTNEPRHEES